jgi:Polysaccharide lyase
MRKWLVGTMLTGAICLGVYDGALLSMAAPTSRPSAVGSDAGADEDIDLPTPARQKPVYARTADGGYRMTSLKSFEGIEEPRMDWVVAEDDVEPKASNFFNITDVGPGTVRMFLRYRRDWWDGDQATGRRDRQRAEVKGLGPHQKEGNTFEYATTWRTDPDFTDPGKLTAGQSDDGEFVGGRKHFCHVFQLKATNGSDGPPLVTMSVDAGNKTADLDFCSGRSGGLKVVRTFPFKAGEWMHVVIRIKVSRTDGEAEISVNGDPFKGATHVPVYRPRSTDYRPKWGLYRAIGPASGAHDDWVEHRDVTARKLD